MIRLRLYMNHVFYYAGFSAAITACEKGCQWEMALMLLQDMPQVRVLKCSKI